MNGFGSWRGGRPPWSVETEREEEKWGGKLEVFVSTLAAEWGNEMETGEEEEDKENMLVEDVG